MAPKRARQQPDRTAEPAQKRARQSVQTPQKSSPAAGQGGAPWVGPLAAPRSVVLRHVTGARAPTSPVEPLTRARASRGAQWGRPGPGRDARADRGTCRFGPEARAEKCLQRPGQIRGASSPPNGAPPWPAADVPPEGTRRGEGLDQEGRGAQLGGAEGPGRQGEGFSISRFLSLPTFQGGPRGPKDRCKTAHEASKRAQRRPTRAPRRCLRRPGRPERAPRRPQQRPKKGNANPKAEPSAPRGPGRPEEAPKRAEQVPARLPKGPKAPPEAAKGPPKRAPRVNKH